jgi:hypothetical protein
MKDVNAKRDSAHTRSNFTILTEAITKLEQTSGIPLRNSVAVVANVQEQQKTATKK